MAKVCIPRTDCNCCDRTTVKSGNLTVTCCFGKTIVEYVCPNCLIVNTYITDKVEVLSILEAVGVVANWVNNPQESVLPAFKQLAPLSEKDIDLFVNHLNVSQDWQSDPILNS